MGLLALVVAPAASSAKPATDPDPLLVHLTSLTPSTLSGNEPLTIAGTVTNESDERFTDINLHAFRSAAPITDSTSLAASAAIDPFAYVGDRVTTPGTFATVPFLDPGQSAEFRMTVPRSELTIVAPGVYWVGVHALGDSPSAARDSVAEGRARTFIPVIAKTRQPVDAAIVLPIRRTIWLNPDGQLTQLGRWSRSLSEGGQLDSILDVSDASAGTAISWLVDPAVPAAVARLAAGNPPRSLSPDPDAVPPSGTPTPPDSQETHEGAPADSEPFAAESDPIPPVDPERELSAEEEQLAAVAQAWLDRFVAATQGASVLALPYGDLDVSAAATYGPSYYAQALTRSQQVMAWLGVNASPALAPPEGIMSAAAIQAAAPDTTILLGDTAFAVPPVAPQSVVRLLQHKVVVTSTGAAAGGPGPTPPDDPLAIRQRLLSEAALRVSTDAGSPIVLMLPSDWHPQDPAALFAALDVPWLRPVTVASLTERRAVAMSATDLTYTDEDQAAELDAVNFSAADRLLERADLLAGVLTLPTVLRQEVADEVLMSLAMGHRNNPGRAADSAEAASDHLTGQLESITVEAPSAVTLSSENGKFGADVVNGLDQPVSVRIGALSDDSLTLKDQEVLHIGAGARKRVLADVATSRSGIHDVELFVTDQAGTPLGATTDLQIRAAQVSGIIWLLLAGGALLLFGTIALRLVRTFRAGRRTASDPSTEHHDEAVSAHE